MRHQVEYIAAVTPNLALKRTATPPLSFALAVQETYLQKFLRVLGSIAAALVLGALGSGLWEKVLSPTLAAASAATAATISRISTTYQDSIYQRAARDVSDLYTMKLAIAIFIIVGILHLVFVVYCSFANSNIHPQLRARLRSAFLLHTLTFGLTLVVVGFFFLAKIDAAAIIKERSLLSLEILRPAIGDPEYVRLRSRFYSMSTKGEFDSFRLAVLQHGGNIRIPLSEFPEVK